MKQLVFGFVGALTAAALALPAAQAETFKLIVTETETPLVPNSVADLAIGLGYYKRAGVDVELVRVQQTPSAVAALRSGQGDMANIAIDTALQLVGRDQMKLKGVVSPDKALPFMIAGKKSIAAVKDLNGKVFGVARVGSADYALSRVVLKKLGADVDSLRYLAVGQPPVRAQALAAGQIDATTISIGVWLSMPDKSNVREMVDQASFYKAAPFVSKLNVVTDAVAKSKAKEVAAVVRGDHSRLARFRQGSENLGHRDGKGATRCEAGRSRGAGRSLSQRVERQWRAQYRGGEIHHRDGLCAARFQGSAPGPAEGMDRYQLHRRGAQRYWHRSEHGRDRPMNEGGIAIRNVSKAFRRAKEDVGVQALQQVSLDIEPNTFVSLVGPSGCGKTTLLAHAERAHRAR